MIKKGKIKSTGFTSSIGTWEIRSSYKTVTRQPDEKNSYVTNMHRCEITLK
jgi:hypothetical protein